MEPLDIFPLKISSPLTMLCLHGISADEAAIPLLLDHLAAKGIAVDFLMGEFSASGGVSFILCVSKHHSIELLKEFNKLKQLNKANVVAEETPVSVIRILGPHFDIRPGILAFLMSCILPAGIRILATSTTITSSLLVVPETQLQTTLQILRETFHIPDQNRTL